MYCVIQCYVRGNQARVKNADLHHPSCIVAMYRRKSASPVLSVLNNFGYSTHIHLSHCETNLNKCIDTH